MRPAISRREFYSFVRYLGVFPRLHSTSYSENIKRKTKGQIDVIGYDHLFFIGDYKGFIDLTLRNYLHELGHFLIAPRSRRFRPNFGIPDEAGRSYKEHILWDLDEARATLIDNYLAKLIGIKSVKYPLRSKMRSHSIKSRLKELEEWFIATGKHLVDDKIKEFRRAQKCRKKPKKT